MLVALPVGQVFVQPRMQAAKQELAVELCLQLLHTRNNHGDIVFVFDSTTSVCNQIDTSIIFLHRSAISHTLKANLSRGFVVQHIDSDHERVHNYHKLSAQRVSSS